MNVSALFNKFRRFADENSPVILTGMAVSGACISAYLAAKGGIRAAQVLSEREPDLSNQDKFILTYKFYAPAVVTLAGTSACMIMATKIGLDRTAAMAGALVVSERTYDQYKDKVKETLGENKHTKIVDAVAQDRVAATPNNSMIVLGDGDQWCFDMWSGRFFKGTMESLKQAVNEFNHELLYGDYASLTEFYSRVGLDSIQESDNIGWNNDHLLEVIYTSVLKDNKPCIAIQFDKAPMPNFHSHHK